MEFLTEVDDEFEPKGSRILNAVKSNARLRTLLTITVIILVLGIIAVVATYSSISTKIEAKLEKRYEEKIESLEKDLEKATEDYEDKLVKQKENNERKLAKQQEDYEEKLTNADEKHSKEIEKKDQKIAELEERIKILEVQNKVSFDEIETQIKTVGKLTTVDYHYTYAGTHEDALKFFNLEIGITKNSFIAQWDGVVALGVDMSKVKISVDEANKAITISIPKAEIFYHDVDEESFEILDEKNNVFNPISTQDKINFDIKYEKKIYEKIEQNRLLEDAFENAKSIIANILNAVPQVATQYTIHYKQVN